MSALDRPLITTPRTVCRLAVPEEAGKMCAFLFENREHLSPWEPIPAPGYFTEPYWADRLVCALDDYRHEQALRLSIFSSADAAIIGLINFTSFERGPFQNCRLGYKLGAKYVGKGFMFEALQASITYVFSQMNLHRIEANVIPRNRRSRSLLERLGFQAHGTAEAYLQINGHWEDHILTSLINAKWIAKWEALNKLLYILR